MDDGNLFQPGAVKRAEFHALTLLVGAYLATLAELLVLHGLWSLHAGEPAAVSLFEAAVFGWIPLAMASAALIPSVRWSRVAFGGLSGLGLYGLTEIGGDTVLVRFSGWVSLLAGVALALAGWRLLPSNWWRHVGDTGHRHRSSAIKVPVGIALWALFVGGVVAVAVW